MSVESDLEAIDERVAKSQSTSADGVAVTRRSVADEIAWDRYKRDVASTASTNAGPGFRIAQIVPSGGPQ
jgi:hypothetical protein